jgi:hypothetical protein
MSEQHSSVQQSAGAADREDMNSALFAQLVMQQTNMAMMFLGKVAHPESGQTYKDVEAARLFIDQLEMLETKTKGNLTREETGLLKQSLMNLRMAFVEAVDSQKTGSESTSEAAPAQAGTKVGGPNDNVAGSAEEEEHRKKFSKKY